jgi:hypothetical protein
MRSSEPGKFSAGTTFQAGEGRNYNRDGRRYDCPVVAEYNPPLLTALDPR